MRVKEEGKALIKINAHAYGPFGGFVDRFGTPYREFNSCYLSWSMGVVGSMKGQQKAPTK